MLGLLAVDVHELHVDGLLVLRVVAFDRGLLPASVRKYNRFTVVRARRGDDAVARRSAARDRSSDGLRELAARPRRAGRPARAQNFLPALRAGGRPEAEPRATVRSGRPPRRCDPGPGARRAGGAPRAPGRGDARRAFGASPSPEAAVGAAPRRDARPVDAARRGRRVDDAPAPGGRRAGGAAVHRRGPGAVAVADAADLALANGRAPSFVDRRPELVIFWEKRQTGRLSFPPRRAASQRACRRHGSRQVS